MENQLPFSRRDFIRNSSLAIAATVITPGLSALMADDVPMQKTLGLALVGLGQYSSQKLAPALEQTKNVRLTGIVTGTPSKAKAWKKKYGIPDKNVYDYANFDDIAHNKDIDIVYVVLPNSMHKEFVIRAAKAGKHVICEKPMATSVADAQEMIKACKDNNVQLAMGYRLHFEPFNKAVMEFGQTEKFGKVKSIKAIDNQKMAGKGVDVWRLRRNLSGGGPLMDLGVYCVQGACYTMGKNPIAVTAQYGAVTDPTTFYDVEESIRFQLEFEGGVVADCQSSYSDEGNELSGTAQNGWWKIAPAYAYDGKKGETHSGPMQITETFEQVDQMDGIARSILDKKPNIVPGEMGLRDVIILMAIYESADNGGKRVPLKI